MRFKIYDYLDNPTLIDTGNKKIKFLKVSVITGNEVVNIHYKDGTIKKYYSNENERKEYFYGRYIVPGNKIKEWILLGEKRFKNAIAFNRLEDLEKRYRINVKKTRTIS